MPARERNDTFGRLLRHERTLAALSQEELAERAGLSARGVSDLERGIHRTPRLETVRMLADALALKDDRRRALIAAARADEPRAVATRPDSTLPVAPTRLIGREAEITGLVDLLLQDRARLVTLTGPGGSGKTRLALAVAMECQRRGAARPVFVDLAPLRSPNLVLPALADALGVPDSGGRPLIERIQTPLTAESALIVLDNFEHLLDAAGVVSDLLARTDRARFLTTSREPLRLRGERVFPVLPLALPDLAGHFSLVDLESNPAVALFIERARDATPYFALSDENGPAIAAICHRLDGLPLALELAAARIKALPAEELLRRLDRRLPLLTGGARDAPRRQRTLRDAIAWSYDLLSDADRLLLRRLSVFVGAWRLDDAEAIVAVDDDLDVLSGILSLVDKHLVLLDDRAGAPRYRMLETVREFAEERLAATPDAHHVLDRHARHFADLACALEDELSAGVIDAVARIRADLDNVRAAMSCLIAYGDRERALRTAGSMSEYWVFVGGHFEEGYDWLNKSLAMDELASPAALSAGYYGLAILHMHEGDVAAARVAATESLTLARKADGRAFVRAAFMLSMAESTAHRHKEAYALAAEALDVARQNENWAWLGWALLMIGAEKRTIGETDSAVAHLEESVDVFRRHRGSWGEADAVAHLAQAVRDRGDLADAARRFAESLLVRRDIGAGVGVDNSLIGLAEVVLKLGDPATAVRLLGAAEAHHERLGFEPFRDTLANRRDLYSQLRGQYAAEEFEAFIGEGRSLSANEAISEAVEIADRIAGRER